MTFIEGERFFDEGRKKEFFWRKGGIHRYTANFLEKEIFCYQRVQVLMENGCRIEVFDGEWMEGGGF